LCQVNCTCAGGEPIPTVSEWGLVILMLSLLVGIKLKFARHRAKIAAAADAGQASNQSESIW
jgi:hypothetical protein